MLEDMLCLAETGLNIPPGHHRLRADIAMHMRRVHPRVGGQGLVEDRRLGFDGLQHIQHGR